MPSRILWAIQTHVSSFNEGFKTAICMHRDARIDYREGRRSYGVLLIIRNVGYIVSSNASHPLQCIYVAAIWPVNYSYHIELTTATRCVLRQLGERRGHSYRMWLFSNLSSGLQSCFRAHFAYYITFSFSSWVINDFRVYWNLIYNTTYKYTNIQTTPVVMLLNNFIVEIFANNTGLIVIKFLYYQMHEVLHLFVLLHDEIIYKTII